MDEELELFKEDASEQLQYMENALLSWSNDGIDNDKIGEIFRAMHTIKGTAGMFGFTSVVDFTHIAENLLDEIRSHTIDTTHEMIDLFLQCKDHCETLVQLAVNEMALPEDIVVKNRHLLDQLLNYMPNNQTMINKDVVSHTTQEHLQKIADCPNDIWHVSIRFHEDFFTSGMDILSIFSFFGKMGEILMNIPVVDQVPLLEELDPLKSFIGFEMAFQTNVGYDEIEEIFEFVIDDVTLHIFKHDDQKGLQALLDEHNGDELKRLFFEQGMYTAQHLGLSDKDSLAFNDQNKSNDQVINITENQSNKPDEKEMSAIDVKKKFESQKSSSLRVDSTKVDQLITQISEMVIANAKITQIALDRDDTELEESVSVLTDMLEDVRNGIMNIRMVQVEDSFIKFRRIVNDTAKKIGKEIDFVIIGGETELDKTVVEKISDPLVHMLRNSVDHGIELPEERVKKGKNRKGRVELKAFPDAGTIVIQIMDDGAGLNKEILLNKAIANGIVSEDQHLSDKEIYELIFEAGLSTSQTISDISGRGVGMDVVRRNIEGLRGVIDIESQPDKGTLFTIRLPLTLAIIDGFLVQAGDTKYVIPLENIQECIELTPEYEEAMKGNDFINLRGEILPILDVKAYLKTQRQTQEVQRKNVVVVRYANKVIGLHVDELYGEHQTVIKPLGDIFQHVEGISGASILGTGEVSLIFDIPKLIEYRIIH